MTTKTIDTMRAQLARMVNYHEVALDRRASASTPDEIKAADRAVRDTAGMLDVSVIELALLLAEGDPDLSRKMRTALARAMRKIKSPSRSDASRKNGAAPVREGSRRRGRPSKGESPE